MLILIIGLASATSGGKASVVGPNTQYYKSGVNSTINFYVYDSNGAAQNNATMACNFYLTDSSGTYTISDMLSYDSGNSSFYYTINNTLAGTYDYDVYCNDGALQGWTHNQVVYSTTGFQNNLSNDSTSGIAVLIFFLVVTLLLYAAPAFIKFGENKYWNLIIGRCLAIIATYLLILDAGVVANIASAGGLVISSELSQIIFLVGTFGYVLIFALFLKTLFDAVSIKNADSRSKRMGEDDDGGDDG